MKTATLIALAVLVVGSALASMSVAVCIPSRLRGPRSVPQLAGAFIAAWSATVKTEVRQPMNVNERLEWIWAALGVAVSVAFAALCAAYFCGWLSPS